MGSKLLIILLVYVLLVFLILPKVPVHMGITVAYLSTELHCYSWVVAGSGPMNYSTCGATYNPDSIKIISSDGGKLTGYCTEMYRSSVIRESFIPLYPYTHTSIYNSTPNVMVDDFPSLRYIFGLDPDLDKDNIDGQVPGENFLWIIRNKIKDKRVGFFFQYR